MGIYFLSYEKSLEALHSSLVAGGIAGLAYWISIYPIDVVKSCIQSSEKQSYMSVFRQLYGTSGFFRGIFPCIHELFRLMLVFCHL